VQNIIEIGLATFFSETHCRR